MAFIDPEFLSQFPIVIAQRFEFVTTASFLVLHKIMVYSFEKLATIEILFSTHTDLVNELCSIKYHNAILS